MPCVTTDIGDRRNIVEAAGIAVAPGDAQALAKGILSTLGDAERAERMRAAAYQMRESLFSTFVGIYA